MVRIDVDVSGFDPLLAEIEETENSLEEVSYVVGSDVRYAVYLERGTEDMRPYPFLFPAVRTVMNSGEADAIADSAQSTAQLIRGIAFAIERAAKRYASTGVAPGPDVQSGTLRRSIQARRIE